MTQNKQPWSLHIRSLEQKRSSWQVKGREGEGDDMVLLKPELKIRIRNGDKIKNYTKWGAEDIGWAWSIRWGLLVHLKANWS